MDEVYAMLVKEKEKAAQKKVQLDKVVLQQKESLLSYQTELKQIQESLSLMKTEVRRAVEKEVKETVYRKNRDRDYVYDYPCQIPNSSGPSQGGKIRNSKSIDRASNLPFPEHQVPYLELKKREVELDKKESQLYEWEATLFEKKMKIDNQSEQLKGKLEKLTSQKSEVQQNLKKLQILTQDYETMLQKEYEMN